VFAHVEEVLAVEAVLARRHLRGMVYFESGIQKGAITHYRDYLRWL
jgi:hypothetical protein